MQLALIGVGRVGGLVVDALVAQDRASGGGLVAGAIAVDTAVADVESLRHVPTDHRITVGAAYPCRAGVEGDNELGASIAAEDLEAILAGVDCLPSHRADAFLVVAALGGGTGGGGAPVVARALHRLFSRPVYGLGVLPTRDADDLAAFNAARSLVTFVREVDNLVVVDTEDTSPHDRTGVPTLARRIAAVFGTRNPASRPSSGWQTDVGGETVETVDLAEADGAVEPDLAGAKSTAIAVYNPDVATTVSSVLATGRLSVLSGARLPTEGGLLARLRGKRPTGQETMAVVRNVRDAAFGVVSPRPGRWAVHQSPAADDATRTARSPSAEAAWLVIDGPAETLSRHGVAYAHLWLRAEVGAGLVGGRTTRGTGPDLTSTLLLSGVHHVPRLDDLWAAAVQSRRTGGTRAGQSPQSTLPTLDTVAERVEPLF